MASQPNRSVESSQFTYHIDDRHKLCVVPQALFLELVAGHAIETRHGWRQDSAWFENEEGMTFLITNRFPPQIEQIDRDDAWSRRLELAHHLENAFAGREVCEPSRLRHEIPLKLLSPLYLQGFAPGANHVDVMRYFTRNSQHRFDAVVRSFLGGRTSYNTDLYASHGPTHPGYSHIEHLGCIYYHEIELVLRVFEENRSLRATIVDIGTGAGHFLLSLAEILRAGGLSDRVRLIGIDKNPARDMVHGAELAKQRGLDIQFLQDDVTCEKFPDRLRRLRADFVVANHVLEHLEGEVFNRYLQDWLLAAGRALMVSVPLKDVPGSSLSDHECVYDELRVAELARRMELRVGYAVLAENLDHSRMLGLIQWVRTSELHVQGGFSGALFQLSPSPSATAEPDPLLDDFTKPFDHTEFQTIRRAPKIGMIRDRATFARQGDQPRQVRQLLIKMPGTPVVVPTEFAQFEEAIQTVIDHNKAANPSYDACYAYLNVFRGLTKFSSYRGLSLNCHGDQLQTLLAGYAFPPDWSYIMSNDLPTTLFEQSFDLSDAVARARAGQRVNVYDDLNAQADRSLAYYSENFGIYLLSPYVVHSASDAEEDLYRVFAKVAFSTKRFFDNRELRWNPAFEYRDWYLADTVGYMDGFFSHAHWNERFLAADLIPGEAP